MPAILIRSPPPSLPKSFNIKIYTIAVGKGGMVPFPVDDPLFGKRYVQADVEVDETTLKRIADITGGLFFRARDTASLSEIYERINKLEKSEVKVKEYRSYNELFPLFPRSRRSSCSFLRSSYAEPFF